MPDGFSFQEALTPDDDEEGLQRKKSYDRNKEWTRPGAKDFRTTLAPAEETQFKSWVKANNVPNDDGPQSDYDMRGFWKALQAKDPIATSGVDPNDKKLHYPDRWKTPYHETFSDQSLWADPAKAPKWNDKDQLVGQDGKVLFDDRAKKEPGGFSFEDALKPQQGDDLPWDVPLSGAQMRARRKADETVEALVPPLKPDETISVPQLLGRIFARTFLQPAVQGGQSALGERPLPTGTEGLQEAALGATPFRAGIPADPIPGVRPRVEPAPPGEAPPGDTLAEAGVTGRASPAPAELGGFTFEEATRPYERVPDTKQSGDLAEAGLTPTPADEPQVVAQPQADGTVKQVQVKTGEPPPPPTEPPTTTPVEAASPIGPEFRQLFPDLSDEQFEALFMRAAQEVPGGIPISPAATQSWLKRVGAVMQRLATPAAAAQAPKAEPELTPESLAADRERFAKATPPEAQTQPEPTAEPVAEAPPAVASQPVQGYGGPWTPVMKDGEPAKNHLGDTIYQNPNGARAIMEGGIPWSERLTKDMAPSSPGERNPRFMVEGEEAPEPKPRTADTPKKEPAVQAPEPTTPRPAAASAPIAQEPPKPRGRKAGSSALPSVREEAEKPPEPKSEWEYLGTNADGVEVYKNAQGVHSTLKEGIRSVEPVRMRPTKSGMEMAVPKPEDKDPEYQVVEPAPKTADTPQLTTPSADEQKPAVEAEKAEKSRTKTDSDRPATPRSEAHHQRATEGEQIAAEAESLIPKMQKWEKDNKYNESVSKGLARDANLLRELAAEHRAGDKERLERIIDRMNPLRTGQYAWSDGFLNVPEMDRWVSRADKWMDDLDVVNNPRSATPLPSDIFTKPADATPKSSELEEATPKEKYDALYPSDTPASTGEKSELKPSEEKPTVPSQEGSDAADDGKPTSGDGGLGKPGSGSIRPSGSRAGSGGRKGRNPGLAPAPADDVASAGGVGNTGQDGVRPEPEVPGSDEPIPDSGDAADGRPGAGGEGVDEPGTGGRPGPELDLSKPKEPKAPVLKGREVDLPDATRPNFFISEPERMVGGGDKARFNRNRRAIEAFQSISEEGRDPTEEELETMAGFTGWGSFGQDLFQGTFERQPPRPGWDVEAQWLRNHLGKVAWDAAHNSISNAHYTDPPTVEAMWNMARQMGFNGGRVLEPSMGIGNFFGLMPRDLMAQSTLTGIELDPTTGGMAKLLYPEAGVFIKGFQESKTPDNFYDMVIGNWPFDATPPADRKYNRLKPTLHDYFYLKALDQTRPGGLVIGITSAGTMDKMDRLARMEMAKKGELVAAFRLPTGAFEKYAGTKVVTDIIILRKRSEPLQDPSEEPWINTKDMDTPAGEPIRVNQYYHDHPENVLGTFDYGHGTTTFRPGMLVHRPENMMERLQSLPETLSTDAYRPITRGDEPRFITSNAADRLNSVVIGNDGNLYQVAGERLLRLEDVFKGMGAGTQKLQKERSDQVRALVGMRKAYGALIDAERDGRPDVEDLRKALSDQYKAYNQTKTKMIDTPGMKALDRVKDPNWPILAALQRPDGTPALILSQSVVRPRKQIGNPSVADAYVIARNEAVTLNMDRIAELSGRTAEEAAKSLLDAGAVYRTPGGGYEPSDGYLSGNVRLKLREAQDAVERGEPMEGSVEALTKVIPKNTPYYQIEAKLGSSWVSPKDYQQFIAESLLELPEDRWPEVDVNFLGSRWNVELAGRLNNTIEATQTHGHPRYRFDRLLTAAMGNTSPRIMDPRDKDGGPYYNAKASEEVATRIQEVREKFQDWIWKDAERTVRLEAAFNEALNAVAKPHFDGSFMDMSGMALLRGDAPFDMRRHQANGIWRGISLRRGLFAHEVGTGKTYTIGGIAIEGRRYGRWNKPMLIAHNANSKSVARDIQAMYPGAKVLSIDSDDLTPKTLKQSMYSIRNEDWDLVVVQHSHLNRFALKKETLMGLAREQITAIEDEMYAAAAEDGENLGNVNLTDEKDIEKKIRSITAKQLAKQRLKILNKIEEQGQRASKEDAIPFEDLGIDCILVDEAHVFKKPPIATRMRVKGLNTEASAMSIGLDFLTKYIKNNNNGNNVFLFTGTPVTNSLNEIFNMSKYFMDDVLKRDGIGDWDPWFNTFANALNDVELVSTGDYETIRRLSAFDNVDELVRVMSQFTDVVQASDMPEFVDRSTPSGKTLSSPDLTPEDRDFLENGRTENPVGRPYKRIINDVSEILPEQAIIQQELRAVIRNFKEETPKFRKENRHIPVVVEGQMSNASLDPRMHDPNLGENPNNKINRVTKNVLEIYQTPKAAQMIFLDNGYNPGKRNPNFSVVDALVDKLVKGGIPRNEIAIVAGGLEPDQKAQIASDMNSGKIRVAIGQSNTLGVGVNAQDNLRAMHHMDAPWMPGELEQRDGRGHRAGNAWNTVLEYRYITEGLDGKRWQVLTIKDRFIKQFIGAFNDESGKRIGSIEGDAADISEKEDIVGTLSAAAGDPRLMQREKLRSDVNRLQRREQQHTYGVADAQRRARQTEESIAAAEKRLAVQRGYFDRWMTAQARMEEEAKEAGAKVRWYDAVIDGVPLRTSAEIQDAMDKRVKELAQGEDTVKIGTINGFTIFSDWGKRWTEPSFYMTGDSAGQDIAGSNLTALTVNRVVGRIQAIRNDLEGGAGLDWMKSDVGKLKKAAEQPFTQAEALLKKRQQLAKLEDDLAENPVPPPAWLRHGAAIDTPIWVDGQERMVRGHRMSDDYYVITDEGDVPYMKVTDKNGFNTFTQKPPPPKLAKDLPAWAAPEIAKAGFGLQGSMVEGAEVIWHGGDLVLIKGRRDGETMFLGFKKGLPEDRQAHDIYGTRGAFEVKDIERMRKEAGAYRDREENKRNLEKAEKPDELIRGGHSQASGRYISPAWTLHNAPDDLEPD